MHSPLTPRLGPQPCLDMPTAMSADSGLHLRLNFWHAVSSFKEQCMLAVGRRASRQDVTWERWLAALLEVFVLSAGVGPPGRCV